jgi:CTP synthase (UTP-ammonia lyase)
LGILDAEHEESSPNAPTLLINRLTCSLVGQTQMIKLVPGTLSFQAYGGIDPIEAFRCNYGLNKDYLNLIVGAKLKVAGLDPDGEVRIIELTDRHFFMATLFLPQLSSSVEKPNPLIFAYLKAIMVYRSLNWL